MEWLARKAEQTLAQTTPVPSPCISVCRLDPVHGWCQGCLRTVDELRQWSQRDEADKRVIWARIGARAQQLALEMERPPRRSTARSAP